MTSTGTFTRSLTSLRLVLSLSTIALLPIALAHGEDDHADSPSPSPSTPATGASLVASNSHASAHASMVPYLHFTPGVDTIWFLGWVPRSAGAIVGTCIGLFVLAIVERWVGAMRARAEAFWRHRGRVLRADAASASANALEKTYTRHTAASSSSSSSSDDGAAGPDKKPTFSVLLGKSSTPFILSHDLARGALHAFQAALGFGFMLVVMTYNVGYILSIVLGLGVGEMLFGRFIVGGGGVGPH